MASDDDALRRILTSGKAESGMYARRGFQAEVRLGREKPASRNVEEGGGGNWLVALLVGAGWFVWKVAEIVIPILLMFMWEVAKVLGSGLFAILTRGRR